MGMGFFQPDSEGPEGLLVFYWSFKMMFQCEYVLADGTRRNRVVSDGEWSLLRGQLVKAGMVPAFAYPPKPKEFWLMGAVVNTPKKMQWKECPACNSERFLRVSPKRSMLCPTCQGDGGVMREVFENKLDSLIEGIK